MVIEKAMPWWWNVLELLNKTQTQGCNIIFVHAIATFPVIQNIIHKDIKLNAYW